MRLCHIHEKLKEFSVPENKTSLLIGTKWISDNMPNIFDAHTIAKGLNQQALESLDNLINGRLDSTRAFHTAIIGKPHTGVAFGLGGSEYGPYTDGYAMVLSRPNEMLEQNGTIIVYAVLVSKKWEQFYLKDFIQKYPQIKFFTNDTIQGIAT